MPQLSRWPRLCATLGAIALAACLLASACQSAAPVEPTTPEVDPAPVEPVAPVDPEEAWAAAAARAEAATALVFDHFEHPTGDEYPTGDGYRAKFVAFYIGNDEWITAGDWGSGDAQYALRPGASGYRVVGVIGDDFRPVRVIGYDAATNISLLAAPGAGVPPLPLAAALPPPCTPLRLAGYWVNGWGVTPEGAEEMVTAWAAEARAALRFPDPAACDPALPPPLWELGPHTRVIVGDGIEFWSDPSYFAPGTVGAALGGLVTEAGVARLRLHLPDDGDGRDGYWYRGGWWSGGPLVDRAGEVVGVLQNMDWNRAVAASDVRAALDRIRAWAAVPHACSNVSGSGPPPPVAAAPASPAPPFLLYHTQDPAGAACRAGEYAFLATPGDLGTVLPNVGDLAGLAGELRIHPAESSGTDRRAFYATIAVGDRVDFHVAPAPDVVCTYRLTITAVPPVTSVTPHVFGVASRPGGRACDLAFAAVNDWRDERAHYSLFRWHPGAGAPAAFPWNRCSPHGRAIGAETARRTGVLAMDIPAGVTLIWEGMIWEVVFRAPAAGEDRDPDAGGPRVAGRLCDPATGSSIGFDVEGAEVERVVHPSAGDPAAAAALHALFDQIAASVRIDDFPLDGPLDPTGAASGSEANPLAGTEWRLVALGDAGAPAAVVGGDATAAFPTATDMTGWTGCNAYGARYRVRDSELRLDDLSWTEAGCPSQALFRQEQRMQDALATVERFEVSGERLTLHSAGGQVLVFERVGT